MERLTWEEINEGQSSSDNPSRDRVREVTRLIGKLLPENTVFTLVLGNTDTFSVAAIAVGVPLQEIPGFMRAGTQALTVSAESN